MLRRIGRSLALFLLCSTAVPIAVTVTILATFLLVPLPATLPQEKAGIASQISHVYDAFGSEIGVFREFEQNIPVAEADVPEILKQAVIAAEDRRFYQHGGVDLKGSVRALYADVRKQGVVQGGSTITQQYVKNAYTDKRRTIIRKIHEAILATQLDRQTPKNLILFKYLSTIYLGDGAYGVGAASETYFRKPVSQLTISESALLAGLIPAPSRFEPRGNPELADTHRVAVLQKMLDQRRITPDQFQQEAPKKVWLASRGNPPGPATVVYAPAQENTRYPYFVDYVRRYLILKYGPELVFRGGLQIQTTLDPQVQEMAEKAVSDQLKGTKDPLEMALASVEPPTGFVKAIVGGRDFTSGPYAQVNLALGGCYRPPANRYKVDVPATCWDGESVDGGGAGRQPGSAFKPFVLATALAKGYSPSKTYSAPRVFTIPNCRGDHCTIANNEGEGGGSVTLRTAIAESINTVFAQLVRDVGCKDTAEMAKKLGMESVWYSPSFHTCSGTFALGVSDVSPLNMAAAYGVFANGGQRQPPTPVLIVRDSKGAVLESNIKRQPERAVDQVVADNVTDMLRGVIAGGTGRAANIGRPAAGKTGTAENFTNAWFVGYTPTLSTAVWMGKADGEDAANNRYSLRNIRGVGRVFGGTIPAQTWHNFMLQALKDVPATDFNQPAPIKPLADALQRNERGGFDVGPRRTVIDTGAGGTYLIGPGTPAAVAPTTTTTTTPDDGGGPTGTTSTTSSTLFKPP